MDPKDRYKKFFDFKEQKATNDRLNKKVLKKEKAVDASDTRTVSNILPTYSINLNKKLGGGFRRRKIHMTFGDKSSGKSFGEYKTTAFLQRTCRNCGGVLPFEDTHCEILKNYFLKSDCNCGNPQAHRVCRIDYESDYESVYDPEETETFQKKKSHAEKIGVIPEMLTIIFASSLEECVDIMKDVLLNKAFDYVSIDSIQAAQSDYVFDREGSQQDMGVAAKFITRITKDIQYAVHFHGVDAFKEMPAIHIISQVRMQMGGTIAFANYSGGKALGHHNSVIMKNQRTHYITADGNPVTGNSSSAELVGIRVAYKNEKNKLDFPYFQGEVDMFFKDAPNIGMVHGDIDYIRELVDIGVSAGTIRQKGAYFYVGDESFQGKLALTQALKEMPDVVSSILDSSTKEESFGDTFEEEEEVVLEEETSK